MLSLELSDLHSKLNLSYSKVEAFNILLATAALLFHHVNQKSKYILERNKLYPRRQIVMCYNFWSDPHFCVVNMRLGRSFRIFCNFHQKGNVDKRPFFSFMSCKRKLQLSMLDNLVKTYDNSHTYNVKIEIKEEKQTIWAFLLLARIFSTPNKQKKIVA